MVYLVLHNIRSIHNVGSIFRTADAAGVAKIYLTGYTPAPVDRFGRKRKDFMKVSLGAEDTVPWEQRASASALLHELHLQGAYCVAVEQASDSIDYRKIPRRKNIALLFGNEVFGIPRSLLNRCDCIAEIPMCGRLTRNRSPNDGGKESLNASVAVGIILFETCAHPSPPLFRKSGGYSP